MLFLFFWQSNYVSFGEILSVEIKVLPYGRVRTVSRKRTRQLIEECASCERDRKKKLNWERFYSSGVGGGKVVFEKIVSPSFVRFNTGMQMPVSTYIAKV